MIHSAKFKAGGISFLVQADEKGITTLQFNPIDEILSTLNLLSVNNKFFFGIKDQLDEYFSGRLTKFDLPLNFQKPGFAGAVYREMKKIQYGKTLSYGEIAQKLNNPSAARAVGNVCGANKIPIIIPCHRVLASGGKLGGFSGGLEIKGKLLLLEGISFH